MLQWKKWLNKNTLTSQRGWILLESLVGVIILSVAIVAMVLTFTQSTKGTAASANRTKATYLAQQELDKLKAQDGNPTITPSITSPVDGFTITLTIPTVSVIANDTNTKPLSNYLKPYQVTVSWTENNIQNNVTMLGYCYVNP